MPEIPTHPDYEPVLWGALSREMRSLWKILDERDSAHAMALRVQAAEYERRLHELNGEHARALENWRNTVPREIFMAFEARTTEWHTLLEQRIAEVKASAERNAELVKVTVDEKAKALADAAEAANKTQTRMIQIGGLIAVALSAAINLFMRR